MKKVYYKGQPYDYKVIDLMGIRQFLLFQNDVFMHFVEEKELDKKSIVSLILDDYYSSQHSRNSIKAELLN